MHLAAMCELSDKQVSHSKLWRSVGLACVLEVNTKFDDVLPGANQPINMGARTIFLGWPMFADGISLFRKLHQQSPGADTDIVIPNCEATVTLLAQINKSFLCKKRAPEDGPR